MHKKIIFLAFLIGIALLNFAGAHAYTRNPNVSEELWNTLEPYFLPEDMPEKKALDKIFHKKGILESIDSLLDEEFLLLGKSKKIIVTRHAKLRGFVMKTYVEEKIVNEGLKWKTRIDNARKLQEYIHSHGYSHIMKVPKKWIYPLPSDKTLKRNFVLIAEDMYKLTTIKNKKAYRERVTPAFLDMLFFTMRDNILWDSVYAHNIPFCSDGRIAFLDTEHAAYRDRPIRWELLGNYLTSDMQKYWFTLIKDEPN